MSNRFLIFLSALAAVVSSVSCGPRDGSYTFHLYTTNDIHGHYFDSTYVGDKTAASLLSVSCYVDSLRKVNGAENVILVDAGDCVQGNNAAYYYNYADTSSRHIFASMADYIGYDAVVVGNHDIEAGHPVYDRLVRTMETPLLAANALRDDDGSAYFREYVILKRHGFRIAVIGMTNPNIKNWLSQELWSGMHFESLLPYAQQVVDRVKAAEKPDVVIVAVHSGTGKGDASALESQGLDLLNSLRGVDFVVCAHDHRPVTFERDSIALINAGSHCRNLGHGTLNIEVKDGRIVSKSLSAELIPVDRNRVDTLMRKSFRQQYEAVRDFTVQPIGELSVPLRTRDSYKGACDYMNFLHTVSLSAEPADISFAAPLTFNGHIADGQLIYNDLFKLYPFENQLFVVSMTGSEIRKYLEASYDNWINTVSPVDAGCGHILKISQSPDPRTDSPRWSFVNRAYNFDSAGGLVYDVDVTKRKGERVIIRSLASGEPFSDSAVYNVAMTSYRASGGGGLMREAIGEASVNDRIVARHREIRDIMHDFIKSAGTVSPANISDESVVGSWKFIPSSLASPMMEKDMELLFGR